MFQVVLNFAGITCVAESSPGERETYSTETEAETAALRWRRFFDRSDVLTGDDRATAFVVGTAVGELGSFTF